MLDPSVTQETHIVNTCKCEMHASISMNSNEFFVAKVTYESNKKC